MRGFDSAVAGVCKWGGIGSFRLHRLCGVPSPTCSTHKPSQLHRLSLFSTYSTFHILINMTNGIVNGTGVEDSFGEMPRFLATAVINVLKA